ncbi:MAG TPA: insulinase family protein [Thermodesulfobacteriaceae bacterium]|nr:insulinase family protein [Thermodesulfobacteriaceae bacterium]
MQIVTERCSKTVLPNGIRVLTEHMPGIRSVSVGIWVTTGSRDESLSCAGISHFIEHMIFKGTARRSALDIAKAFDQMGGLSNAFTSKETTCFHAKVLDTHLDDVLELLADIFLHSIFEPVEIERERQVILQEINMVEDSPDDLVHELFSEFFWHGNRLGGSILGAPETVRSFDSLMLRQHMTRFYAGPEIVISASGNLEHQPFVRKIERLFTRISPATDLPQRATPNPARGCKSFPRDLEQIHTIMGFPGISASDPRRYAALLLNVILGGSMSSRLFQEVREKRGLAYSIYSFLTSYEDTGMLGIYAGVSPDQVCKVTGLMYSELLKIAHKSVDARELDAARSHVKGSLFLSAENSDSRMTRLARNEISLGKFLTFDHVIEALDSVTPDHIKDIAAGFVEKGAALVCLGPVTDSQADKCENMVSAVNK